MAPGPVRPVIAAPGARHGVAVFQGSKTDSWFGIKTLWYSLASYQIPVLIRGSRLDAPGRIAFGEAPTSGFQSDTGSPYPHVRGLMRSWPGATFVKEPGCYGFQVDGLTFSYHLVLNIKVPTFDSVPG